MGNSYIPVNTVERSLYVSTEPRACKRSFLEGMFAVSKPSINLPQAKAKPILERN